MVNSSFACADNNLKTNVFFQERRSLSREYKLPPCFRFRLKGETSWQTFPHTVFKYIFFSGFKGRNTVLKFQHQPMFAFSLKIATRGLCKSASLVISDFLKFTIITFDLLFKRFTSANSTILCWKTQSAWHLPSNRSPFHVIRNHRWSPAWCSINCVPGDVSIEGWHTPESVFSLGTRLGTLLIVAGHLWILRTPEGRPGGVRRHLRTLRTSGTLGSEHRGAAASLPHTSRWSGWGIRMR